MTDDELQRLARKRVAQKTGFAIHLLVYLLVNGGLAVLSLSRGGAWGTWHWGPLLGWGLGLAIHGLVTLLSLRGQGMKARLVAAEVQRLRARQ
ncbi:MAG: 2TM domain-containing protein [Pseudomonadota bacterium]